MGARQLARSALRRLLPPLMRQRWLVRLAQPVFVLIPSLKPRLQRVAATPMSASPRDVALDDAQLRVLLDLRDAAPPDGP